MEAASLQSFIPVLSRVLLANRMPGSDMHMPEELFMRKIYTLHRVAVNFACGNCQDARGRAWGEGEQQERNELTQTEAAARLNDQAFRCK